MDKLIEELGINWKLLASQAVNFLILLVVLRLFVYKPVLEAIENRRKKIEEGLAKSKEADLRLKSVDEICKNNLKESESKSISLIESAKNKAKEKEQELVKKAEDYQKDLMQRAELAYKKQQEESKEAVFKEAAEVVKKIIAKTVELDPEKIDEALIKKAALEVKNNEISN